MGGLRIFVAFVIKEAKHVLRDTRSLIILLGLPVVMMTLFGFALSNEVKNSAFVVLDRTPDPATLKLLDRLGQSRYFSYAGQVADESELDLWFRRGDARLGVVFPGRFDQDLRHLGEAQILGILVTMVGAFLSALNIVQEKEAGTIEQINVTPIRKVEFTLGKLIPFWVLGMVSISLGIIVARIVFGLWPVGSLLTVYIFSALYLIGVLGIGLFVSTITESQQQATLISFFIMMIFVLLGGLYTPIESMPPWAQYIAAANPPSYFIEVIRAVYIKGSNLGDMLPALAKLGAFAVGFNALAVWSYRKRSV